MWARAYVWSNCLAVDGGYGAIFEILKLIDMLSVNEGVTVFSISAPKKVLTYYYHNNYHGSTVLIHIRLRCGLLNNGNSTSLSFIPNQKC